MRPRRKNPATVVVKSATSHATAPTLVLAVLPAESAGTPAEVDILEGVAVARSATSAARSGILPAIAMREEVAADTEGVMDRAKVDMEEEEVAIPVEVVVRVRRATPVGAMVICLVTALKVKNATTVSSSSSLRRSSTNCAKVARLAI